MVKLVADEMVDVLALKLRGRLRNRMKKAKVEE